VWRRSAGQFDQLRAVRAIAFNSAETATTQLLDIRSTPVTGRVTPFAVLGPSTSAAWW
jgi:hypothetical protein